jgi:hypothetical protein
MQENFALAKRIDAALNSFMDLDTKEKLIAWSFMQSHLRRIGALPQEQPTEPAAKRGRPRGSRSKTKKAEGEAQV